MCPRVRNGFSPARTEHRYGSENTDDKFNHIERSPNNKFQNADVSGFKCAPESLEFEFVNHNVSASFKKTISHGTLESENSQKKPATKRKLFGGSKGKKQQKETPKKVNVEVKKSTFL